MGPTGAPTEIAGGETVVLVGGGLGNAVLFSIGRAFRAAGSRVLYFAGYKKLIDRYKVEEIEAAADVKSSGPATRRPASRPAGRRTRASPATSSRPCRLRRGRAGHGGDSARRGRPHHHHRLGRHDGGGGRRRATAAQALPQARPHRHRLHQLAHAMHDEGDLRPVPAAAPRSRRPAEERGRSSPASTRTSRSTGSTSRRWVPGSSRTACRRS